MFPPNRNRTMLPIDYAAFSICWLVIPTLNSLLNSQEEAECKAKKDNSPERVSKTRGQFR
jgi:hypothetical protein